MASAAVAAHKYWGNNLINRDKSPTPVFEQLLLGVAHYINRHVTPWDVNTLTPAKLAAFYRLVGGDYDGLFLETEDSSLAFIYQSLGCFHSLQPERDPYVPPRIPALTPQGFVRWQTVQLLLEPEEHVPFLQKAVKSFGLINPADGGPFPSILPREILPTKPDPDMIEWYATVSEKLRLEAQASTARHLHPRPPKLALSDVASSRESSVDSHSITGYYSKQRNSQRSAPFLNGQPSLHIPSAYTSDAPWSPERRRNSLPGNRRYPASWPRDGPTPTTSRSFSHLPIRNARPSHVRVPSDVSTISTSTDDSSSVSTSSTSMSPVRYHHQPNNHLLSPEARRHSSTILPPHLPTRDPQEFLHHQRQPSGDYKTRNVSWQDIDDIPGRPSLNQPNYGAGIKGSARARGARLGDREWDERGRGRTNVLSTGVGGRRYP